MRPLQWIKNFLVFAALFFQPEIQGAKPVIKVVVAFFAFCLISAGVYIFNDLFDRKGDMLHPEKSRRPIASGALDLVTAGWAGAVFLVLGLGMGLRLGMGFLTIVGMYLCLNIAYSAYLKNIVILDAFIIAFGFVLRVVAGAEVIQAPISFWIVLCTILASLFLTFSKRRHELTTMENASEHRMSLAGYDPYFLDQMIAVVTAGTVIAYSLWTRDPQTVDKFGGHLTYTIPFVCYGIFRYLYIVHHKGLGGDPTQVFLTDVPLMLDILLWAIVVALVVY